MARPKKDDNERLDPVMVRMPAYLHEALKVKAAQEERTMAQAIRYALKEYVGLTS
jgi:predicted HicB family RNase H-like nuclease